MEKQELMDLMLREIKNSSFFPLDKGLLRDKATYGLITEKGFDIIFDGNILKSITGVNYLPFLEKGTKPHIIYNAFGLKKPIWHPGSLKHQGFIKVKSVDLVLDILKSQGMEADISVEY